jgi:hypothetical protein
LPILAEFSLFFSLNPGKLFGFTSNLATLASFHVVDETGESVVNKPQINK